MSPIKFRETGDFKAAAAAPAAAALAAAALSILCVRGGFLGIFFLLPPALAGFLFGGNTFRLTGLFGTLGNAAFLFALWKTGASDPVLLRWHAAYYTLMLVVFCWINDPSPGKYIRFFPAPIYRLVLGSLAAGALTIPLFSDMAGSADFSRLFAEQMGIESAEVRTLLESMEYIGIRGGIFVSILFFFAVTRQAAVLIVWFARRKRSGGSLISFHAPAFLIWVLSVSLGALLLGKAAEIAPLEIAAWNILAVCATLYLAQGGGIALYFMVRLPPFFRIAVNVAVVLILLRPGINVFIPGILILAGIVENWIPLRVSRGPPPTPEA